jgi:DNA mismatch repair protein MutS
MKPLTPAIKQYLQIKSQYPDSILFFRMGDFYEMFFEDAHIGSRELEIALTSRNKGQQDNVPLCGIPYHAAETYLSKLLQKGYKVAICEQVEDPRLAKGIVKREVVRVFTPGLSMDPLRLGNSENHYLMSFCAEGEVFGLAFLDISTGAFRTCQISGFEPFLNEAFRNEPKEILTFKDFQQHPCFERFKKVFEERLVNYREDTLRKNYQSLTGIKTQFQIENESDLQRSPLSALAAEMAFAYAKENQKTALSHLQRPAFYQIQDFMVVDETTKRNLELTQSLFGQGKKGSLFWVLDETMTAMGSRKMREWLNYPLMDVQKIGERLEGVSELKEKRPERGHLRGLLKDIQDIERLTSRIYLGHANARDLVGLKKSLKDLPQLKAFLTAFSTSLICQVSSGLEDFRDLHQLLETSIVDDPPLTIREGGIIKSNYNKELDELRQISREGKGWILKLEAEEKMKTGISSLKIRYNQVFGYSIEVTKSNLHLVPDRYIRKQNQVNGERFITPELKEFEKKVLGAEEAINRLESQIFEEVRKRISDATPRLQKAAYAVAVIDVLGSLAEVAERYNYTQPVVDEEARLVIQDGRHPVIERMTLQERFVPNDTEVDHEARQILVITGPNMAGKSTYLRQVALITLMAQMGSFVPARQAQIGLVDRVFTRIGASDNLSMGQSTFMVEMMETARILNQATSRSLVILDEIGRGTSTFDGLSIAWAVVEYLHDHPHLRPKTLFATHYHELTELALTKERVKNYNVAVSEWNHEIIFLRKIVEGGTNRSYGIQVARLAGIPQRVIDRAREILLNLEKGEFDATGMPKIARTKNPSGKPRVSAQLSLFDRPDPVRAELRKIQVDRLTPLEALNVLDDLKKKAAREE